MTEQPPKQEERPLGDPVIDRMTDRSKQNELQDDLVQFMSEVKNSGALEALKGETVKYRGQEVVVRDVEGGIILVIENPKTGEEFRIPSVELES